MKKTTINDYEILVCDRQTGSNSNFNSTFRKDRFTFKHICPTSQNHLRYSHVIHGLRVYNTGMGIGGYDMPNVYGQHTGYTPLAFCLARVQTPGKVRPLTSPCSS